MKEKLISSTLDLLRNELGFSLKEQEDYYNDVLEEFPNDPFFMSQSPNKNFVLMEKTVFCQNWMRVVKELNDHQSKSYKTIKSQLQLFDTSDEIAKFAADRINAVQLELQNNKWNHLLNINDFQKVLNEFFIYDIFLKTFSLLDGKLYQWQTQILPQKRREGSIVRKYQDIVQEDFFTEFADLLKILSEAKLLQIFKRKLANQEEVTSASNPYPLVFIDKEYYQFFIYCMEAYQKSDVTKTLLSKYFEFFKLDNLILDNVKPKNFFQFIQKDLKKNMSRIEPYSSSEKTEKGDYESLKISFFS